MATISDISEALGNYMLKGWVLTDQSCPSPGCSVPLVRSPQGRTPVTTLCVKCDSNVSPSVPSAAQPNPLAPSSDASTESRISRSSTPPTEISDIPGSPTFIPIEESEESRRRRAQSNRASSEIGKKLLQGWAMLGDECPNETCYGVPLVRPPKAGGEKDPRKECVICGNIYVSEIDWAGRETLVPYQSKDKDSNRNQTERTLPDISQASAPKTASFYQTLSSPLQVADMKEADARGSGNLPASRSPSTLDSSKIALDETLQALQSSLRALSSRLTSLASSSFIDAQSIGTTADAITKVASAMVQVQQLQVAQGQ